MSLKYSFQNYVYPSRWMDYYYQVSEILKCRPQKVLEVGIGNRTVSDYLKSQGIKVTSLDIDRELKPDVIADVLEMPFPDESFDAVLCAEVLEHLPFGDFAKALRELERVSNKWVVLSLPHWGATFHFSLKLPFLKRLNLFFKIPGFLKHRFDGEHHWEIGKREYPLKKIKEEIKSCHLEIIRDYIPSDSPYHRFFILKEIGK